MKNVSQSKIHCVWSIRHRLFVSILFAMVVAVLQPPDCIPLTRRLCAWNAGAVSFLILTWILTLQGAPEMMRHHDRHLDAGSLKVLVLH
ncbi:hypothetical protein QUA81_00645 [Microcoleus sp. F6_B4]